MDYTKNIDKENDFSKEELEKEKEYLEELIVKSGMKPSDPLFKLWAQIGSTQYAIMQLPGKLDAVIAGWTIRVDNKLNNAAEVAIIQQQAAIAKAAEELVRTTKKASPEKVAAGLGVFDVSNLKLAQIGLALGCVLALGAVIGAFTFNMAIATVSATKSFTAANLKPEDARLLEWAKSKQGRDARSLYNKNAGIIQTCRQTKNPGGCIIDAKTEK
ncbi:DUF6753 family protein [Nostoc sp. 'Peltigera membranacea cyanobiont' 232]|uniref:DUF6753 family protein n=1 Tax=Nostoc sp. 'Peltigera membranacea cyanobiont' 232 TaxID=2014531 RepID=UPI000B9568DD|nr:DUF6753 family protein [Nostoc sp. 'Peltigera membranacea cyanobiont' 232]OYE02670.1 hypothetical protein CDG79_22685 [Nostoc sp. 'Peltigera membranacea cyanobiont' 232]